MASRLRLAGLGPSGLRSAGPERWWPLSARPLWCLGGAVGSGGNG